MSKDFFQTHTIHVSQINVTFKNKRLPSPTQLYID